MDKETPATQDRPGSDVFEVARRKFGRLATLFSSTAAVAAFLLFAGFLSEFAVYRFAGLPRLSFNLTALIESGVEVLVDTLALAVSDWARGFLLLGLFVAVLLVWSARESTPWIDRLARSPLAFYLASLMTLVLAGGLLLGQIELARQGLLGSGIGSEEGVRAALETAYAKEVPKPRDRMRELERRGYEVPYLPPVNWVVDLLQPEKLRDGWSEVRQGIPMRTLPESRDAARQVYGWLVLGTLVLLGLMLILHRWREWLDECLAAETDTRVVWAPRGPFGPGGTLFALAEPIRFLVAPLTLVVGAVAVALLPISHGILARPSIGSETVMVLLRADSPPGKSKDADSSPDKPKDAAVAADKPKDAAATAVAAAPAAASSQRAAPASSPQDATRTPRTMALSCAFGTYDEKPIKAAIKNYDNALRVLLQTRQSSEERYELQRDAYREALWNWARLVVESNCADEFRAMWERRPPRGLASISPDVPVLFRTGFSQVAEQFPRVRFGTILRYPRDSESLELIDTIKPRDALSRGQWAIDYYDRKLIDEVVVLPDTQALLVRQIKELLRSDPDNDNVDLLLANPTPDAVDAILDLIKQRTLFPTRAGVLVTYAGHMVRAIGSERPDLAGGVSDLLIDLASSKPTAFWPNKDADIRGAAATALHLSGGVYAAKLLADEIDSDKQAPTAPGNAGAACGAGIQCIPQVISTAGYLLQDVLSEQQELRRAGANPPLLDDTAWRLTDFLVGVVANDGRSANDRGAGCSALKVAGRWSLKPGDKEEEMDKDKDRSLIKVQGRLSTAIEGFRDKGNDLSLGPCISAMPTLSLSYKRNRRLLREIVADGTGTAAWPLDIQEAAFSALYQMGLSGESGFLFGLFADTSDWRAKLAAKFLEDTVPEPLSADLLACAEQAWQTDTPRALRCLHGLNLLDDDWDGDQDAVIRLHAIMRQTPPEPVRAKVCQVMKELQQRDSNLAGTALRAVPQGSRCGAQDYFVSDNQRERWKHYTETVPGLESPDL